MIGDRLKQARKARQLAQRELAAACGVSAQAVSNYENGKDAPSSDVLIRLANALRVSVDYFFRTVTVHLGEPACRKDCNLTESRMAEIESNVRDQVERYVESLSLFPEDSVRTPVFACPDTVREPLRGIEDAEDRADSLRDAWGLGLQPIESLTDLLEEWGIVVIHVAVPDGFDGCTFPNGNYPVIVVNKRVPGDRMRFDLAHELGHLVLAMPEDWSDDQKELAAHRFAEAFLVPGKTAKKELGLQRSWIVLRELHDLKHKYGMSMGAWIYRSQHLGITNKAIAGKLFGNLKKNGTKTKMPGEPFTEPGKPFPREHTNRHVRLVARAYADGIISQSRAAELLASDMSQLDDLFTADVLKQSGLNDCVSLCRIDA